MRLVGATPTSLHQSGTAHSWRYNSIGQIKHSSAFDAQFMFEQHRSLHTGSRSSSVSPMMPCKILEEVMQVSGRPTAPAKSETRVVGQLSICHAASLDALSLLRVCACSQVDAQETAGQGLQVLLRRLRAIDIDSPVGLGSIQGSVADGHVCQHSIIPQVVHNLECLLLILQLERYVPS